jgi:hypothetical protein
MLRFKGSGFSVQGSPVEISSQGSIFRYFSTIRQADALGTSEPQNPEPLNPEPLTLYAFFLT